MSARLGATLLNAIYEAPHDEARRMVYADWLQERGDPRGELIVLQYRTPRTPEQQARERELLEEHAEQWQGRLAELTTWVEFERGFLARCGVRRIPTWALKQLEWTTVKHVGVADEWRCDVAPLLTNELSRSLESIRIPQHALAKLLGGDQSSPVRQLVVDGTIAPATWTALPNSRMFERVTWIDVRGHLDPLPIFAEPHALLYERVDLRMHGLQLTCERGTDQRLSRLSIRPLEKTVPDAKTMTTVARFLASLSRDALTELVVSLPKHAGLQKAIERQRRLSHAPAS